MVGILDGKVDEKEDGRLVGCFDGFEVNNCEGKFDECKDGSAVGSIVGILVGEEVVGKGVGTSVGVIGEFVGDPEGKLVGWNVNSAA